MKSLTFGETGSCPAKRCKFNGPAALEGVGRPRLCVPQPSRSLLPMRVIRVTPRAPLPPSVWLSLRYVGLPGC